MRGFWIYIYVGVLYPIPIFNNIDNVNLKQLSVEPLFSLIYGPWKLEQIKLYLYDIFFSKICDFFNFLTQLLMYHQPTLGNYPETPDLWLDSLSFNPRPLCFKMLLQPITQGNGQKEILDLQTSCSKSSPNLILLSTSIFYQ